MIAVDKMQTNRPFLQWQLKPKLLLIITAWIVASLILVSVELSRRWLIQEKVFSYQEGDFVDQDYDIKEDLSFVDEQATRKLIRLNRSLVNPVFIVSASVTDSVLERFDRFTSYYIAAIANRDSETAVSNLKAEFPDAQGLIDRGNSRNLQQLEFLMEISRETLENLQYEGIFRLNTHQGISASGLVEVVFSEESSDRRVTLIRESLVQQENLSDYLHSMESLQDLDDGDREFIIAWTLYFAEANGFINDALTEESRNRAEAATESVYISMNAGTRLLNAGTVVTNRQIEILKALKSQKKLSFQSVLDTFLFMAILFILGYVSAVNFNITISKSKTLWLFVVIGACYILIAGILNALFYNSAILKMSLILPTALCTLLLTQILQNRKMAILSSFLMALLVLYLSSGDIHEILICISSGIAGTLSIKWRETRMGLLRAGPRIALIISLTTFLTGFFVDEPMRNVALMTLIAAGNGIITGILSLAFLPLLEHLLNTATTFRLIELSDQNVPILKRMRLQAPGTFIHSQNVAHLAEAACDAIGADGLLARVGAYFHDIGKVDQAHYFVENQSGENKHDDMKAILSATVIKSHVKIGIEKARELRLPDEVLEVIEQHHGTSIIRYFYDRAKKEKGTYVASPDDFSYGGPKPRSREAAVVMLADSAEAATRTLKNPSAAKLEKYVWDLIMERFKTGELNESSLTLKDLETVKKSFVQVLTGHFHSRIEYPEIAEESH